MSSLGLPHAVRPRGRAGLERRAPTRAAHRLELHLLDAQAMARIGSWEIDLATGALSVTPELRRIFGCGAADVPDVTWICEHAHPNDRRRLEAWFGSTQSRAGHSSECLFRLVRHDGTIGMFHGQRAMRLGRHGRVARICGTIQDVTGQVAGEGAVNEAAHLYRDIFENCAWGVFQTTADGRYITANPALARIYGYESPDQLLGKLTDIGGQLYVERGRRDAFVGAMKERGVVHGFESQVYRRDGSIIWIAETCREVRTSTGGLLYYEGTVEDISERKRSEAALTRAIAEAEAAKRAVEAANQALEARVAQRTAELRAAQDELVQKERFSTLGKVTGTVAHELRNPLSAIRNSMHVIGDIAGPDRTAFVRPLARIERCVARCEGIIADLIEYSHARKLHCRTTRLDEWLRAFLDGYALAEGIVLEVTAGAAGAQVQLDHDRFKRVMVNLLDNAAHALADDSTLTTRRIAVATACGADARITIADTGPGIPADVLPQVFDPLFSTKSFGTGLGLPTVRQIVEQHGGTVELTSTPGRGTRIEISLPRV